MYPENEREGSASTEPTAAFVRIDGSSVRISAIAHDLRGAWTNESLGRSGQTSPPAAETTGRTPELEPTRNERIRCIVELLLGSDRLPQGTLSRPTAHVPAGDAATPPAGRSAGGDAAGVRRCLLVVEDNADIRECFGELLEAEGFTVILAVNGADALARLDEMTTLPDLILLDLMMPVMDGFEFRAKQRSDMRVAHIPVVAISADPRLDDRHDVLMAYGYLQKPCDIDRLVELVSRSVHEPSTPRGSSDPR